MVKIVIAVELTHQRGGKPLPFVLLNLVPAQHSAPSKGNTSKYIDVEDDHGSGTDAGGQFKSSEGAPQAEEDQEMAKKIQLLKDKMSSNASVMPNVLKRMKECISKIDKLDSNNGIIHPAFKRKKTS
ncbi:uncharacterized protein LOC132187352 isoform X2 [Corylus avellana]|uniref:uncharacterized protein LOC132187352 isoform X2 n=1 Tax=Corylus avellana TaxID=13451 RepID=UPI00286BD2E4|nr:uncharacterized protein LOC132187352 isoform X2 [Corylus avellana]